MTEAELKDLPRMKTALTRYHIEEGGFRRRQLAKVLDIHPSTLSIIINNNTDALLDYKVDTVMRLQQSIADEIEVDLDKIIEEKKGG